MTSSFKPPSRAEFLKGNKAAAIFLKDMPPLYDRLLRDLSYAQLRLGMMTIAEVILVRF